ncbi:MAG: EF-hand domain-containing protein [Planctomycetota bacterium]|nr:EF-hand domain-containing protein [Planctomycetota bacterium]
MQRSTKSILFSLTTAALGIGVLLTQPADGGPPDARQEAMKKFAKLDKNKNNKIERTEFPGDDELFGRADRDGDGVMSFEEGFEFVIEQEVEKIFMKLDKDRDGSIHLDEVTDKGQRARFALVDTNGDDKLSGEEVLKAVRKKFAGNPEKAPAGQGKLVGAPPPWADIIAKHDANKDGQIQASELKGKATDVVIKNLDLNDDQVITKEEYARSRKRFMHILQRTGKLKDLLTNHGKNIGNSLKGVHLDKAEAQLKELEKALEDYLKATREAH